MEQIVKILEETGLPFAYDHFAEGESPDPPFICYLVPNSDNFAADGKVYYKINELHIELYTDCKDLSAEQKLEDVLDVEVQNFALLFEFDGDIKKIRHVLYNCAASRPSIESQTNEDEIEVKTETLSITATPLANGYVKAKTGDDTTDTIYADWYKSVYMPTADAADLYQSA